MFDHKTHPAEYVNDLLDTALAHPQIGKWNGTSYQSVTSMVAGMNLFEDTTYVPSPEARAKAVKLGHLALNSLAGGWSALFSARVRRCRAHLEWMLQWYQLNPGRVATEATCRAMFAAVGPNLP